MSTFSITIWRSNARDLRSPNQLKHLRCSWMIFTCKINTLRLWRRRNSGIITVKYAPGDYCLTWCEFFAYLIKSTSSNDSVKLEVLIWGGSGEKRKKWWDGGSKSMTKPLQQSRVRTRQLWPAILVPEPWIFWAGRLPSWWNTSLKGQVAKV